MGQLPYIPSCMHCHVTECPESELGHQHQLAWTGLSHRVLRLHSLIDYTSPPPLPPGRWATVRDKKEHGRSGCLETGRACYVSSHTHTHACTHTPIHTCTQTHTHICACAPGNKVSQNCTLLLHVKSSGILSFLFFFF
jgi:hypothetical protein